MVVYQQCKKKNTHNIVHERIWILIGSFLFHGGALTVCWPWPTLIRRKSISLEEHGVNCLLYPRIQKCLMWVYKAKICTLSNRFSEVQILGLEILAGSVL